MASTNGKAAGRARGTGVLEVSTVDRDRVFEAFRRWGYLEADLDPLGSFAPQPQAELQLEGEDAEEARRIYCGTVGAEFMHIADPERRRWIQDSWKGQQAEVAQEHVLDQLIRADFLSRCCSSAIWAASGFRWKA